MENINFGEGYTNNLDEKMKTKTNNGGMLKMNMKKLLILGMILGMVFVMVDSASAAFHEDATKVIPYTASLYFSNTGNVTFTFNVTGNSTGAGGYNCTLYTNITSVWVANATLNLVNDTTIMGAGVAANSIVVTGIPNNVSGYGWYVRCINSTNETNFNVSSGNRTFYVDTVAPTLTWNAADRPVNLSYSATGTGINLNFTVNDSFLQDRLNCTFYTNGVGSVNTTNSSILGTAGSKTINLSTILANGTYSIWVSCSDNATNTATSTVRTLYVDTGLPTVTLLSPNNIWMSTGDVQLKFNYTDNYIISGKITNCTLWADFNGTRLANYTIANVSNNTNTAFTLNVSRTAWASPYHWDVNCTNGENPSSTANASAGMTFFVENTAMVTNYYVTNAAGTPYGFDDNGTTALNRSVIANQTNNITVAMNTSAFGNEWSYRVEGYDGQGSYVNITTGTAASAPSAIQKIDLTTETVHELFKNTTLSTSTSNYVILVYIYNNTGANAYTGYTRILNLTHWSQIYTIESNDTTAMSVGTQKSFLVRIKNQTGNYLSGYINITGINDDKVGNLPVTGQAIGSGGAIFYVKPENSGNVTIQTVGSGGVALSTSGILSIATKIIAVTPKIDSLNVVVNSAPTSIYKDFNTNITINITLLNETATGIYDYTNYSTNITYNVSLTVRTAGTAGKINVTKAGTANPNANGHKIDVVFNYTELNSFNSSLVGSGTVPLDVNVVLNVDAGTAYYLPNASNVDYNTTSLNAASIAVGGDINIMSPVGVVNLSAGKLNTVTFEIKNNSNGNMNYNVTLVSTSYFYNVTTAVTTIMQNNDTNGQTTFTITPEQNGTITATIRSGIFTPVTKIINVFGSNVNRSAVSPVLGSTLTFNQTYNVAIPVKRLDGLKDYGATVTVSGIGYSISGNNLNISSSDNYVVYTISMTPNITGKLNITVTGGDGYNATFLNAYDVLYTDAYTLTVPGTLTRGLNNTFNATVLYNNTIASGNLTVTYYDINGTAIITSTDVIVGVVSNKTTVTTVVPTAAYSAKFTVSNTTSAKSGNASATVLDATILLGNVSHIINSTNVVTKANPTNLVLVNGVPTNITFTVNAPNAEGLIINLYNSNTTGTLVTNYSALINYLTTSATIAVGANNISNIINATQIAIVLENANNATTINPTNVTISKQAVTSSRTAVPTAVNTTVTINVSAYGNPLVAVNVSIVNSTGTVLAANLTDATGTVSLVIGPTTSDTLKIAVNNESTGTTITSTKTLNVTYSPAIPYTDQTLVIYVRPLGSPTEVVTGSYVDIREPGATGYVLYSAADGSYKLTSPKEGVYSVYAEKTDWTNSATVYINVLNPATRANFANVTPSVTSISVNTSSDFTVTVTNSTGNVDGATVTLSGAGVSTSVTTNASGIASFTGITATSIGTITVTASKDGYNNKSTTIGVSALSTFTSVTASPGSIAEGTPANITVTVAPAIENATVTLSGAGISTSALTSASGIATFSNVNATSAGTITVIASKAGYNNMSTTITVNATTPTTTTTTTTTTSTTSSTTSTSTTTTSTTTTSTTTTSTTTTSTTTTTLPPACKGDANDDGVVSDFELLNYIDSWAEGSVEDFDLLDAIDSWAAGHC